MATNADFTTSDSSPEKHINTKTILHRPNLRSGLRNSPRLQEQEAARSPERFQTRDPSAYSSNSDGEGFDESGEQYSRNESIPLEDRASPVLDTRRRTKTPAPPARPSRQPPKSSWIADNYLIVIITALVILAGAFMGYKEPQADNQPCTANCSEMVELKKEFPNQDQKLFKSLKAGIEATVNGHPPELSVFSLFSTDAKLIDNVMQEVIKVAKQCMNQTQDPIVLTKEQLGNKLIEDYKDELKIRQIMVVEDIDQASPSTVASLHAFCDTYNPLVAKSVIFFTIKVPRRPTGKPIEYITEYLNERWKTLDDHVRMPLITRMLDQTFFLKP